MLGLAVWTLAMDKEKTFADHQTQALTGEPRPYDKRVREPPRFLCSTPASLASIHPGVPQNLIVRGIEHHGSRTSINHLISLCHE